MRTGEQVAVPLSEGEIAEFRAEIEERERSQEWATALPPTRIPPDAAQLTEPRPGDTTEQQLARSILKLRQELDDAADQKAQFFRNMLMMLAAAESRITDLQEANTREVQRRHEAEAAQKPNQYNRLWYLFDLAAPSFCAMHCGEQHRGDCREMRTMIDREKATWKS